MLLHTDYPYETTTSRRSQVSRSPAETTATHHLFPLLGPQHNPSTRHPQVPGVTNGTKYIIHLRHASFVLFQGLKRGCVPPPCCKTLRGGGGLAHLHQYQELAAWPAWADMGFDHPTTRPSWIKA